MSHFLDGHEAKFNCLKKYFSASGLHQRRGSSSLSGINLAWSRDTWLLGQNNSQIHLNGTELNAFEEATIGFTKAQMPV